METEVENDVETEVLTLSPSLKIIWDQINIETGILNQINTEMGIWDQINTKMGRTQAGILDQKLARLKKSADVHSANRKHGILPILSPYQYGPWTHIPTAVGIILGLLNCFFLIN